MRFTSNAVAHYSKFTVTTMKALVSKFLDHFPFKLSIFPER